jgi:hypothetical protein
MTAIRRIVCLANSRKVSGRCIAGKEMESESSGQWMRPVSARATGEISEEERRYEDGTSAQVLDVIDIPVVGHAVCGHQSENYVIDPNEYWVKVGAMPRAGLAQLTDHPESLWKNGDSTLAGQNDRVRIEAGRVSSGSLYLISPEQLTLHVMSEGAGIVKLRRRVRASFLYRSTRYNWVVTDPIVERAFLAKPDGSYSLDEVYLCVSLSEVYSDGYSYKLVAAII